MTTSHSSRWLPVLALGLGVAGCGAAPADRSCELSAPGASWLAFGSLRGGDYGLRLVRADGSCERPLADSPFVDLQPAWSSAGDIAFTSNRSGALRIWLYGLATGAVTLLDTGTTRATLPAFSPDGAVVAFEGEPFGATDTDIHLVAAAGGSPVAIAVDPAIDSGPAWSPDGSTIYFVSTRSGAYEIHAVDLSSGLVSKVTTGSRILGRPVVSPSGDRIYFARTNLGGSSTEVVRLVLATGAIEVISSQGDSEPAVSPDGARLVMRTFRYGSSPQLVAVDETDGGHAVRLTNGAGSDGAPVFSRAP